MGKLNMTAAVKNAKTALSKHMPEILVGTGIVGMWTTTVLAVIATPKAVARIEEEREVQEVDKLTPLETVKACWKYYIPAAATGILSTACLIGASRVSIRRSAALATAYKLSESALAEYKNAVVDTIGEKKERVVRDKMAENAIKNENIDEEDVIITGRGNTRCYDAVFGRCFRSSREVIERAINAVNRNIVSGEMYASLNDFYDELDLDHVDIGDLLGWNLDDGEIKINFSSQLAHSGEPTLVIHYNVVPKYDFYKFV
jgi:hypothetical protein